MHACPCRWYGSGGCILRSWLLCRSDAYEAVVYVVSNEMRAMSERVEGAPFFLPSSTAPPYIVPQQMRTLLSLSLPDAAVPLWPGTHRVAS
jgi:hypothetical protein